jgi:hypothetical protein
MHESTVIPSVIVLHVVEDGNPLFRSFVEVLRVVFARIPRGEIELDNGQGNIIDGKLEVRISGWLCVGMEPEQTADTHADNEDGASD